MSTLLFDIYSFYVPLHRVICCMHLRAYMLVPSTVSR